MLMRRGFAQLSLLALLAVLTRPYAVPWREKNAFKIATTLPTRLIDSIMAQGNWNILFQEGPFAGFQRQIAIANHFAVRGDARQADFYFEKAGNALDIAYASLRGRFGWPRNPREVKALSLPWGENRETFEDFLLCRLQFQIESMLSAHESGVLRPASIESLISETEKQLITPLRQKDSDLEQMAALIREAQLIRAAKDNNPVLQAHKFALLSDRIPVSNRNYWSRRMNVFRIFENIHHGNIGRALYLARLSEEKQKDQGDPVALARIYIQAGEFTEAERVLATALQADEIKNAENYGEYLSRGSLLQNLLLWLGRTAEAARISSEAENFVSELIRSEAVPRDELVDLKKTYRNENLRGLMYTFALTGRCPENQAFSGDSDMEVEWRVRERIFFEKCNLPRDNRYWAGLNASPSVNPELKWVIAYHLAEAKAKGPSPFTAYLAAQRRLQKALARKETTKLTELFIDYLKTRNIIQPEFGLFDWGMHLTDDLTDRALDAIPRNIGEKPARELFSELHRRLVWQNTRKGGFLLFAPADAVMLSRKAASSILEINFPALTEATAIAGAAKSLVYADTQRTLIFEGNGKNGKLQNIKKPEKPVLNSAGSLLFGSAALDLAANGMNSAAYLAPFQNYCPECGGSPPKTPERLVILPGPGKTVPAFTADLADNFSVHGPAGTYRDCPGGATRYDDTVIATYQYTDFPGPCNIAAEKIVVEYDAAANGQEFKAIAALAWRRNLAVILLPQAIPEAVKTSFLFDFFQRVNRRQAKTAEAFRDAKARAEKSFPAEANLGRLSLYESIP